MEHASGYTKTGGRGNKLHDNNNVVFGNGTDSEYLTNRMIEAAAVTNNLLPIGVIPNTESQARPLTVLEPAQQREAMKGIDSLSEFGNTSKFRQTAQQREAMKGIDRLC